MTRFGEPQQEIRLVVYCTSNGQSWSAGRSHHHFSPIVSGRRGVRVLHVAAETAQPPARGTMAFDSGSQRIVFATVDLPALGQELWSYDGNDWVLLPADGTNGGDHAQPGFFPIALPGLAGRLMVVDGYGVRELLTTPARAETYGTPCGPDAPVLAAASLPLPGNASFALEISELAANGLVAVGGADAEANIPLFGCSLLIAPGQALAATVASPTGFASFALPLPALPSLIGSEFFFQAATLSSSNPSGFVLGAGLRLALGE